jgi:hypothetical protein
LKPAFVLLGQIGQVDESGRDLYLVHLGEKELASFDIIE